jgi:hypothetical protein
MRHGSVDISKLSGDPERYSVTFATPAAAPRASPARTFAGLADVEHFLRQTGIADDRWRAALDGARRDGTARIDNVVLEDRELHELGLRTDPQPE